MKKNKLVICFAAIVALSFFVLLFKICTPHTPAQDEPLPINISIFMDLSDRIESPNSDQVQKDTLIVGETVNYFYESTKTCKGGIQRSSNILKVIFNPAPAGEIINTAADNLQIDVQALPSGKERKNRIKNARSTFTKSLADVYSNAKEYGKENSWPGSDLWGFFNNGVVDQQCIKKGYRNVLIIITDGEVFYSPINKTVDGKPNFISNDLLNNPQGELLVERDASLQGLEVMILEINPRDKKNLSRMKQVLENWLIGMGVKKENICLYQTDTPANVRNVIRKFLMK